MSVKYNPLTEQWEYNGKDLTQALKENKELKKYIIELEEMLGCAAPKNYCDSCSCGKKERLENE